MNFEWVFEDYKWVFETCDITDRKTQIKLFKLAKDLAVTE